MNPRPWIVAGVLAMPIGAVYGEALDVPFIYDDNSAIVENKSTTNFWPILARLGNPAR
jgi:hypothetical protein